MTPPGAMASDLVTFGIGLALSLLLLIAMRWQIRHARKTGQIFHRVAPVKKQKNPVFFRIHQMMHWVGLFIAIGLVLFCAAKLVETLILLARLREC